MNIRIYKQYCESSAFVGNRFVLKVDKTQTVQTAMGMGFLLPKVHELVRKFLREKKKITMSFVPTHTIEYAKVYNRWEPTHCSALEPHEEKEIWESLVRVSKQSSHTDRLHAVENGCQQDA